MVLSRPALPVLQVRRARHTCAPQQEIPKELSAEDRQRLSQLHTRRVAEIVFKQCAAVLKHVMSHRVPHLCHPASDTTHQTHQANASSIFTA